MCGLLHATGWSSGDHIAQILRMWLCTPLSFHQAEVTSRAGGHNPQLIRGCGGWRVRVVADISMASSWLHKYQDSSRCGSWQNQCGPKASGFGSSFLLPQLSGRAVTPPAGHFCGVVWGVVLKAWLRVCSSPYQQLGKYPTPTLNPFPLKLARMDSLICNWTLTNPGGIYNKDI